VKQLKQNPQTKKPMKLKPGLHLWMVANNMGGTSKSIACAEARAACRMENVPCRLISFDATGRILNDIFRGQGVHVVAKPNADVILDALVAHINQAREAGEIMIADMPSAIMYPDNPILRALTQSRILEEFDSTGLIVPVTANHYHIEGALDTLIGLARVPIKYDRGMIRAWRPEPTWPTWDSLASWPTLKRYFPVWECPSYMQSFVAMMQGLPPYRDYPAIDELPEMLAERSSTLSTRERGMLRAAVNHLESARQAIRAHLLEPIMERANLVKA
jgi:hypothetical protein